ncbi:regulatory protein RecX [Aeromicrobium marinum DSM 15272]|uniref:Regulatory protein RecX n=1 Tax=Aeromicrobium marinum DSM 15272 TaxID=585531 RepID=E2SEH6_9ACTN|nr:regulatory protein RecX [Aeromicrobium marinum]EFQ82453.1 regulatory protein RecX [Aeromicrobium marinum DSM 15272]
MSVVETELTADEVAEQHAVAKQVVYDRLAVRARSRSELEQTLLKKRVPAEVAAVVLDKFEAAGLVDDREFARSWVQGRQRSKGLATGVLAQELKRHGVDDQVAAEALAELDADTERQAAHQLVQKKLRTMQGLDPTTQIRRLTGLLARKGYAPQVAFDVVRAELDAEIVDDAC